MATDQKLNLSENKVTETEVSIDTLKSSLKSDTNSQLKTSSTENKDVKPEQPKEIGGRGGLDPTRYGDWEKGGRCIDF